MIAIARLMIAEQFLKMAMAVLPKAHPHSAHMIRAIHSYLAAVLADKANP